MKRRPHILNYPSKKDPDIIDQLTTYSVAPDIHLYEVSPKYFMEKEEYEKLLKGNSD